MLMLGSEPKQRIPGKEISKITYLSLSPWKEGGEVGRKEMCAKKESRVEGRNLLRQFSIEQEEEGTIA